MNTNGRQVMLGLLAAVLSVVILLGGILLALTENGQPVAQAPTETFMPSPTLRPTRTGLPTTAVPTALPGQPTFTPAPTQPATATQLPPAPASPTPTLPPPTTCPPPAGWSAITVSQDDTLAGLAQLYGTTQEMLAKANCLVISSLAPNSILYVPGNPPTATQFIPPTPHCGPPAGWVRYVVQPYDTLYRLSIVLGVPVYQLQLANCLGNSTIIGAGRVLYVPFMPPAPVYPTLRPPTILPPTVLPPTVIPPTATSAPTLPPPPPTLPPYNPPTATKLPPPTATPLPPPSNTPVPPPTNTSVPPPPPTSTSAPPPPPPTSTSAPPPPPPTSTSVPPLPPTPTLVGGQVLPANLPYRYY